MDPSCYGGIRINNTFPQAAYYKGLRDFFTLLDRILTANFPFIYCSRESGVLLKYLWIINLKNAIIKWLLKPHNHWIFNMRGV